MSDLSSTADAPVVIPRVRVLCLLVLTFTTGIIDALSWLGLNSVFTANMTGNVLIIGMGMAGAPGANGIASACALGAFLLGAATIGVVQRRQPVGWSRRTTVIFSAVVVTVLVLSAVTFAWPPHRSAVTAYIVMGVLAFAMGVQGAEALRLAVSEIITVAVSTAVVGVGMTLFLGIRGERGAHVLRRLVAIALLGLGAMTGALLLNVAFGLGLLVAGVIAAGVTILGHVRRDLR